MITGTIIQAGDNKYLDEKHLKIRRSVKPQTTKINVDTTNKLNTVEWFFGYGGNHLGLKRVFPNLRLIAACEIEDFAIENILAKMENGLLEAAPIWSDCKTFPREPFKGRVDLFIASYPCQPFSAAGKRLGSEDPRHLWPYVRGFVQSVRPRLCFFENVDGHVSMGLSTVLSDLEEDGYKTTWGVFSAAEVGAPHQRKRVFILAVANEFRKGLEGFRGLVQEPIQEGRQGTHGHAWPSRPGEPQHGWEPPRVVANSPRSLFGIETEREGREDIGGGGQEKLGNSEVTNGRRGIENNSRFGESRSTGFADSSQSVGNPKGEIESTVGRDTHENPDRLDNAKLYISCDNRTDELRLLGNGVVPATAEQALRVLLLQISSL
jgi:DNA (cytosine-5)-methyltransferase 1